MGLLDVSILLNQDDEYIEKPVSICKVFLVNYSKLDKFNRNKNQTAVWTRAINIYFFLFKSNDILISK